MNARLRVLGEPQGVRAPLDAQMLAAGMKFHAQHGLRRFRYFRRNRGGICKYENAVSVSEAHEIMKGGRPIQVLSIEGLIAAKRGVGRAKDLDAIPELEAMPELRDAGQ